MFVAFAKWLKTILHVDAVTHVPSCLAKNFASKVQSTSSTHYMLQAFDWVSHFRWRTCLGMFHNNKVFGMFGPFKQAQAISKWQRGHPRATAYRHDGDDKTCIKVSGGVYLTSGLTSGGNPLQNQWHWCEYVWYVCVCVTFRVTLCKQNCHTT